MTTSIFFSPPLSLSLTRAKVTCVILQTARLFFFVEPIERAFFFFSFFFFVCGRRCEKKDCWEYSVSTVDVKPRWLACETPPCLFLFSLLRSFPSQIPLFTMILTKDEIQVITLNAKFVHKYADQAFFANELNAAPQRIGDQPFLNFFVRYHRSDAPECYTWTRVRRVVLLEDVIAAAQQRGTVPPSQTPTVEWRGKTMWVCLAVEPVEPTHASASSSPSSSPDVGKKEGEAEEELVMLPQLSNTVPTDEEVLAFCVASANHRPTEKYVDGVLGDAPVVPPVLHVPAAAAAAATITTAAASTTAAAGQAEQPASLNPRLFVPTARQVDLLRQYRKQHFTYHQWVEEEIEQSKALRERYSSIGVAAAPVRTVAYEHEHRAVERRHQRTTAGPASPMGALLGEVEVSQDPLSQSAQTEDLYSALPTQRSAPSSPSALLANSDAPVSPFLPRSILRGRQEQQQQQRSSSCAFANRTSSDNPLSFSQTPHPLTQDPLQMNDLTQNSTTHQDHNGGGSPSVDSLAALSQQQQQHHLSQLRATEDSFFQYVRDEKRSYYLNQLANITLRNRETNAQNRRRGIANERRLERKGNLLESRGLWITDDKERAKQAEDYVKASVSGFSDAQNDEKRAAKNAVVGGAAGESSDTAKSAEDVFVEKFKAYHDAQLISFADCAGDLLSGTDADVELMLQAASATTADSGNNVSGRDGASSAVRVTRRAVRRLLPNRLNTEEASPRSVQAQLVHRSTLRMAKRARGE